MSESSNEAVGRRVDRSFLDNDLQGVLGAISEDVEWTWYGPTEIRLAGTRKGHEGVLQRLEQLAETVELRCWNPDEFQFVSQGDTVVVLGYEEGTMPQVDPLWCGTRWGATFAWRAGP
jgi:ketosteroid isomerase-like protein